VAEGSPAVAPLSIITIQPAPGTVRVHIAGEIDLATTGQLRAALSTTFAAAGPGTEIRVDLARVTFIDAIGVGALVRGHQDARKAGLSFTVHNPHGVVQRIIDVLGLDDLLGITPT
jgi:anti-anti-sigma factor